ncbi:chromosome segregation protein SMC [Numidum massiliense]|uniref:chromosome segregation protein SMC n=1 Tax=Numidum massiliense TaxID=1522315 RepID=UPI0006D5B087|nr:chromosome segregation protein SMC [Numidum massiliense]
MYLKQLEVNGFKSFAVRTELEFVRGITAVVGPNGSGKSNISDAVRWVLGEQSARTLRGGRMEDVIFAGSDSRQAVNFCEVSLTLDNSEGELPLAYSEVTVTRRLYRSGESEYYLNKQLCRLKDITELLMDTGLGKEAYSIIGQGGIDEVLSTKPEDRRTIFEDAAGIVKFKTRKREAEQKLEETEQNLARLNDLLFELKQQRGPLAEQAETAEKYRKLESQLKTRDIGLYVYRITEVHSQWQAAAAELKTREQEKVTAQTALSRIEAAMTQQKWQLQQLDAQLETEQQALLAASEAVEKAEGRRDVLAERERNLAAECERLAEQKETLQQKRETAAAEVTRLTAACEQKAAEVADLERQLAAHSEQWGKRAYETEKTLERAKEQLAGLQQEVAALASELRHADDRERVSGERGEVLSEAHREQAAYVEQMTSQLAALERRKAQASERLAAARADFEAIAKRKNELARDSEAQLSALRAVEQKLHQLASRRDVLQELEADFSGFLQGVKEILQAEKRGKLSGVEGAVAELVTVPEALESAIETALGGALQHIVVNSEADGRACIAYLKQHRLGRATFLPLQVIRPRALAAGDRRRLDGEAGFVGVAVDLVSYDRAYENIISWLLGQIVVAKTLNDANRLARLLNYRYRVVTLDGDIVNPGGSMSGGSKFKRQANLLGRKRELESLTKELKRAEEERRRLQATVAQQGDARETLEAQLEAARKTGENLRLAEQQLASDCAHKRSECRQAEEQFARLEQELQQVTSERVNERQMRSELKQTLAAKRAQEEELSRDIARLTELLAEQQQAKEAASEHVTSLKVALAKAVQAHEHLLENCRRVAGEVDATDAALARLVAEGEALAAKVTDNAAEQKSCGEQIEQLQREKEQVGERLKTLRTERADVQGKLTTRDAAYREAQKKARRVAAAFHELEVKVNRFDVNLNNWLNALSEQYELSFELAKARYAVPDDPEIAERDVRVLKDQLAALGDVNLGAIGEFRRLTERLQFLESQQQDLIEAKATLYEVIREMDAEMSERFNATFAAIRTQFHGVFRELFGGGRADLQLTDPEAPLTTGIDIVAQPPGKKLQHLSLLSGGERTLTAIGLLFAILRVRPVPFCILDEVEAALDEANIVRFANFLQEFSHKTQFIVITHRKGTMEAADVLYGVTMQESGVSKLVSVKLEERTADEEVAAAAE